jgi:hypothetical protein
MSTSSALISTSRSFAGTGLQLRLGARVRASGEQLCLYLAAFGGRGPQADGRGVVTDQIALGIAQQTAEGFVDQHDLMIA